MMKSNYSTMLFKSLVVVTATITALLAPHPSSAATPYVMSSGDYSEGFADIAAWTANFASGVGAAPWSSVAVNGSGSIPDGVKITTATATFAASSATGVQKGSQNILLLSTGTTDNSTACAIDLNLDFTDRNAGTLTFDWAEVNNSTGNRGASLRVYTSPDGVTFTELSGATVAVFNNVVASGTVSALQLPAALNNSATAVIRFYNHNGSGGSTGSRPKISLDNVAVTSTGGTEVTPNISSVLPTTLTTNAGKTATFAVSASGGNLSYCWYRQVGATSNLVAALASSTFNLPNVLGGDATNYFVVISNSIGKASGGPVTLIVIDPSINTPPQNQIAIVGSNATFTVAAAGTSLTYQWRLEGTNIPSATASSYTRPAVSAVDAGNYDVIVTSTYGSVTSAVATLTVSLPQLPYWDFNNTNAPTTSPPPTSGNGIATLLNGITGTFASGGPTDPTSSTNGAWNTASYPVAGVSNKTAGFEFSVNTSGFKDIVVRWDQRHSGTASKYTRFQYSTDGVNFIDGSIGTNVDQNFVARTNDLTAVAAVNNNPNFKFRIVTEFESTAVGSGTEAYVPTSSANYGAAGTIRVDYLVISSTPTSGTPGVLLTIGTSGNNAVLTWANPAYTLLASPSVTGPYTNVPSATTGYTTPLTGPQMYFRLTNSVVGP